MVIKHYRRYCAEKTRGRLVLSGRELGSTLEDVGRPYGIKIPKETCIPEGEYFARVTFSTKFSRPMILLYSDTKTMCCELGGISFSGIRVHRGTKTDQTEGCVLFDGDLVALENKIQGARFLGEEVKWIITREAS